MPDKSKGAFEKRPVKKNNFHSTYYMAYSKAERLTLMLKFISLESALLSRVFDDFALKLFSEQLNIC